MTEEVISLFRKRSGVYAALCGHAGLHPALRMRAQGEGRPQGDKEKGEATQRLTSEYQLSLTGGSRQFGDSFDFTKSI